MIGLIMAGGSGKRFWPLSRRKYPKQFLKITSNISMIAVTFNRLTEKIARKDIFVVTSEDQLDLVLANIPGINRENIIVEPCGMNTAPAIALSMEYLSERYHPDEVVFVGGADYEITDTKSFVESLEPAEKSSKLGNFVTFGVKPIYAATGYGYIEAGQEVDFGLEVKSFKEKPDKESATTFIKAGNYFWNSGMFMWKLDSILGAYATYLPKVSSIIQAIKTRWKNSGYSADISDLYSKMPKIPVDVGIMEQCEKRVVIPVDYGWSDVGGWKALYEISKKDSHDNVLKGNCFIVDSTHNYVNSQKYVVLLGVNNSVIVDTDDVLLVADINRSEEVKDIIAALEKDKAKEKYL